MSGIYRSLYLNSYSVQVFHIRTFMVSRDFFNPLRCVLIPHVYIEITISSAPLHFPYVFGLSTSKRDHECVAVCLFGINT